MTMDIRTRRARSCLTVVAGAFAAALCAHSADATPLTVYLDARGLDSNNCLSPSTPCLTLSHAQNVIKAINPQDDVTVSINNDGTYWGQNVYWNYVMAGHSVSFIGAGSVTDTTNIPVFDGCSDATLKSCQKGNHWFNLVTSATQNGGHASNIVLEHIKVQHYANPLWLFGDRNDVAHGWNGNNTVDHMVFEDIGNCYAPTLPESWGVVNVANSRSNTFSYNSFENICTSPYDLNVYLHAYYFSTSANDNLVFANTFSDVYGDTVRFRDGADDNTVTHSYFMRTGEDAPVTSWFCHPWSEAACGKATPECPSVGNRVTDSYFDGGDEGQHVPIQRNLYGVSTCGISMSQQNVALQSNKIDYAAWPH